MHMYITYMCRQREKWRMKTCLRVCSFFFFFDARRPSNHRGKSISLFADTRLSGEGSVDLQLTLSKSSLGINVSMLSLNFFQGFTFKFVLNELPQPQLDSLLLFGYQSVQGEGAEQPQWACDALRILDILGCRLEREEKSQFFLLTSASSAYCALCMHT